MLVELFIFFELLAIILFIAAFFTKQELLWVVGLVLFGTLMFASYDVQYYVYEWNSTTSAYQPIALSHSYPYLMAINMIFFSLGVLLFLFDIFDKYGGRFAGKE
jgi:hypothetical protein